MDPSSNSRRKLKLTAVPWKNLPVSSVYKAKPGASNLSRRINEKNLNKQKALNKYSCDGEAIKSGIENPNSDQLVDEMEAAKILLVLQEH